MEHLRILHALRENNPEMSVEVPSARVVDNMKAAMWREVGVTEQILLQRGGIWE